MLWRRYYYYPHLTEQETELQKHNAMCPLTANIFLMWDIAHKLKQAFLKLKSYIYKLNNSS